ncbi:oligosaccharide flippase family protein [Flammeovirga sp. EKP202]|uniref:oligosaccharide flippase family protein n=1 Tax=Flammeovirga sp. EKP202 TaxID=2770592 RepID=UPI00165FD00B|nr:oligosaccharide flippase family protein [Flammeovirga sp. EKP202]MBD0399845.1 oligosaccharide flippase family protein [Flammeovirga sp. EKP202]
MRDINIYKNMLWLFLDKVVIVLVQFTISVKIANEYSSELYGKYAYAISICAFVPVILEVLNNKIIKKKFSKGKDHINQLFKFTFFRIAISFIIVVIYYLYTYYLNGFDKLNIYILLFLINAFILSISSVIEVFYEFKLLSSLTVKISVISNLFVGVFQYIILSLSYSLKSIIIITILGSILRVILLSRKYFKSVEDIKLTRDKTLINTLNEGKYLWLATLSFIIYSQLDKLMIGEMLGMSSVGVYQVADRFYALGIIWIGIAKNSIFPKMILLQNNKIEYKNYIKKKVKYALLFSFVIIVGVFLFSSFVIENVYSSEFWEASKYLKLKSINIIILAIGILKVEHLSLFGGTRENTIVIFTSCIINIILNFILIPIYHIYGAIIATICSQFYSTILGTTLNKKLNSYYLLLLK